MTSRVNHHRPAAKPDRPVPHDPDAERGVLGSVLLDPKRMDEVAGIVSAGDFLDALHQKLWGHLLAMHRAGTPPDPVVLAARLRQTWDCSTDDEGPGDPESLVCQIMRPVAVAAHAKHYARLVRELARRRAMMLAAEAALSAAESGDQDAMASAAMQLQDALATTRLTAVEYRVFMASELDGAAFSLDFLVKGTLVAGQPCIVAGTRKSLKTSVVLDLAVSLATGADFLGSIPVARPVPVGVMSAESGLATIQETLRRICHHKGGRLGDVSNLVLSDAVPKLGKPDHEDAVARLIDQHKLAVLFVDPAYLALPGADAANLFIQGDLLRGVSERCQMAGCTLVLVHHTRKNIAATYEPPELENISWAGFQEWTRQWLLIGRREAYEPGSGEHRLWMNVGGSAGHSALWALDVDEGAFDGTGGRYWRPTLTKPDQARQSVRERQTEAQRQEHDRRFQDDLRTVLDILAKWPTGETKTAIRDAAGLKSGRFNAVLAALLRDGAVETCEVVKANRKCPYEGYKLVAGDTQ